MMKPDEKKSESTLGEKVQRVTQIGSLVLSAIMSSLQIYFLIRGRENGRI